MATSAGGTATAAAVAGKGIGPGDDEAMNDGNTAPALVGTLDAYHKAPEGTALPGFRTAVDAARQARYHASCEVDTAAFAGLADVTILAQDNSRSTTRAGLPNDGRVHTRHVIRQRQPIGLGEDLAITGRIGPYRDIRRGRLLICLFAFLRGDGEVPLEMETEYLLPFAAPPPSDPGRSTPQAGRGPSEEAAEMITAAELALTPDRVRAYSDEVGNRIHFDPAFARAQGYRAPLAQGLMQLTCMYGALVGTLGPPVELDLEVRFLRPVFWDDRLQVRHSPDHRRFRCSTPDGRTTSEMTLARLRFAP